MTLHEEPKRRKIDPRLLQVLLISGGLHVVLLLVLGGITVVNLVIPEEKEFEEPPAVEQKEPPKQKKVQINQRPKPERSSRRDLSVRQVGNIEVSSVDADLPQMEESFTVSAGTGGGGGGGLLGRASSRIGLGVSDVKVFGLETEAERILFAIDASPGMVTDEKGGLNSYRVIKEEITSMVDNLSVGTLFNVMLYDRNRVRMFKPKLQTAGDRIHQELVEWIGQFNTDADNAGLQNASMKPLEAMPNEPMQKWIQKFRWPRRNNTYYITQFALEQNVDAVFFITGFHRGFTNVRRELTERELKEWKRKKNSSSYQRKAKLTREEIPKMRQRIQNKLERINRERKREGIPPKVLPRTSIYGKARILDLEWDNPPPKPRPGHDPVYYADERKVERYFRDLVDKAYKEKGQDPPSVNVVLFLAEDEKFPDQHERDLKSFVRFFGGDYRIIRGLQQIKGAASRRGEGEEGNKRQ